MSYFLFAQPSQLSSASKQSIEQSNIITQAGRQQQSTINGKVTGQHCGQINQTQANNTHKQ